MSQEFCLSQYDVFSLTDSILIVHKFEHMEFPTAQSQSTKEQTKR